MRFQVPQFTDVEDRIMGPFTLKQFIYLAGSAGLCVVFYTLLPFFIAVILMLPVIALGVALAFFKIQNRPFIKIVEASFKYLLGDRLYVWKHQPKKYKKSEKDKAGSVENLMPRLTNNKLKDLTWDLDVKTSPTEPPREVTSKTGGLESAIQKNTGEKRI
jgi:hypothetical protein